MLNLQRQLHYFCVFENYLGRTFLLEVSEKDTVCQKQDFDENWLSSFLFLRKFFSDVFSYKFLGWALSKAPLQEESNELLTRTFDVAASEFPWISKYKDRSITEVEMVHHPTCPHSEPGPPRFIFSPIFFLAEGNSRPSCKNSFFFFPSRSKIHRHAPSI